MQRTKFFEKLIDDEAANSLYDLLMKNVDWEDGPRSKNSASTRKAGQLSVEELHFLLDAIPASGGVTIWEVIRTTINQSSHRTVCDGAYLNYYRDGQDWTPNHSHKDTSQFILSLGATRTLQVNKTKYPISNGDAIIFGSAVHGVPKDETKNGRISVAFFYMNKFISVVIMTEALNTVHH